MFFCCGAFKMLTIEAACDCLSPQKLLQPTQGTRSVIRRHRSQSQAPASWLTCGFVNAVFPPAGKVVGSPLSHKSEQMLYLEGRNAEISAMSYRPHAPACLCRFSFLNLCSTLIKKPQDLHLGDQGPRLRHWLSSRMQ